MALAQAAIAIQFAGGIETKQESKAVPAVKLLTLENGVFSKAVSLVKRNGYDALPRSVLGSVDEYEAGRALATRGDELLMFDLDTAYSYLEGADMWREVGTVQSVVPSETVVVKTSSEQTYGDHASNGGTTVYAWEDSRGGIYYAVADTATGHLVVAPTQLDANGSRPRCVPCGAVLHVYYVTAATLRVYVAVINPTALAVAGSLTPTILIDDLASGAIGYDAEPTGRTGSPAAVAWVAAGNLVRVGYVDASGVLGSPVTGHPSVASHSVAGVTGEIAIAYDNEASASPGIAVFWGYTTGASIRALIADADDPATTLVGNTLIGLGGSLADLLQVTACFQTDDTEAAARRCYLLWSVDGASARDRLVQWRTLDTDGGLGSVVSQRGSDLASRAFRDGAYVYVNLLHSTTFFATYFCRMLHASAVFVARTLPGLAGDEPTNPHLPSVHTAGSVHSWMAPYRSQLESADGDQFSEQGFRLVAFDFDNETSHRSAQLGASLYVAGALPLVYDGSRFGEAGIHYAPDDVAAPTLGTGGSLEVSSTYLYRFWYEVQLANGEWLQGPVSSGTTVVTGVSDTRATFAIPTYRHSMHARVRIGVARGEANDSVLLFRASSLDPGATTGSNRYVDNDATADTVAFVDDMSDATLITKEPLYTNGGILSNDPGPGCSLVATGKNRLFANSPEDPLLVRYSQALAEGYAVELAPQLSVKVDPYGGDITGLAVMDDAVVVFKERAIFAFGGPGPLANPDAGGGFTEPQLITSDVGCSNADSIGYTPVGLIFQSSKGIYLLERSQQVRYVGAPVELYNSQQVRATTLIEDRTQIRLLTDSGSTLLYDYLFDQWSTFSNHEGQDAVVVNGAYNYLRNNGTVYRETSGYQDENAQIPMRIETAWIRLVESLQGMQRIVHVMILGTYKSAHKLLFSYSTDYEPSWSEPIELDPSRFISTSYYGEGLYGAGPYGGTSSVSRYQFQVHLGVKCEAIRFRFEDYESAGNAGAAYELAELLVLGGVRKGNYKPLGEARSY